ncbi:iron-containing alcohol dehydrogenase [Pseudochelatococcus sp. B33]
MPIISYLNHVRLDHGALSALAEDMASIGITRPLIVSDEGIRNAGHVDRAIAYLPSGTSYATFFDTPSNPTEAAVNEALVVYQTGGCNGVIGIGGGSSIDLAKAVAVLSAHPRPLQQYAAAMGGQSRITDKTAPVIAIPTSSGTGSEVGRGAVITFSDGRKLGVISPHVIPKRAICDPDLTITASPLQTAAFGMDAVVHCVECFISPVDNPVAEALALDGFAKAMKYLPRAVRDGSDREARREMMIAAMMGAMSFQKGCGAVHALAHPLGGLSELDLHHGTLSSILLPHVLRFNAGDPSVPPKYQRLLSVTGELPSEDFADVMRRFSLQIGMPQRLSELGVPRNLLSKTAALAPSDHTHETNPRRATEADYLNILEVAF